jgi:hypothetical protein
VIFHEKFFLKKSWKRGGGRDESLVTLFLPPFAQKKSDTIFGFFVTSRYHIKSPATVTGLHQRNISGLNCFSVIIGCLVVMSLHRIYR